MTTSTGLALNCSAFIPSWVIIKTIIFGISTALAVFDTYTDWEVVLRFKDAGLNNPHLPQNEHWTRAWFLFATVGTILTVTSIFHDTTVLLYSWYKFYKEKCCTSGKTDNNTSDSNPDVSGISQFKVEENSHPKSKEDEVSDPLKCCFRHGWNATTRNETLGAIALWCQDVPMLTMSVIFALIQNSCKTPDIRDTTSLYQSICISVTAAIYSCFLLETSVLMCTIHLQCSRQTSRN